MSRVTLYLDEETRQLLVDAARTEGVSRSRWVARLIREKAQPTWPDSWQSCLGAFADFPLRDNSPTVADIPRIAF